MIDAEMASLGSEPPVSSAPRLPRSLLAVLIAAAVVLAGTVLFIGANLLFSGTRQAAPPASATTAASTQPSATPSAASSSPIPTGTTPQAIVDQLDATITDALAAGRIDADAANSLRDKVKDLRESLTENKVGKKARELQKRINELRADAKIDQQTADQLTGLLQPLTGTG